MNNDEYNWIRSELERARQELRDLQDSQYREHQKLRERRQIEIRQEAEYEARHADNWPEALRKHIALLNRELAHDTDDDHPEVSYLKQLITACNRAGELWDQAENTRNREIQFHLAQIEAIRNGVRLQVAAQLAEDAKFGNREAWKELAGQIERNELDTFLDW